MNESAAPAREAFRFGATGSLALLFAINMANYIDRYLVVGLNDAIQKDFKLTDQEVGLLMTAFIWVYMLASPACGSLADRIARRYVVSSAVAVWSLATAFASRAWSFPVLMAARGAVGVGESGYNAAGQALLSDLYPLEKRSRVLAVFNLALPVGAAAGFYLAGELEPRFGWKNACLFVGLPGLALAALALGLPDVREERAPGQSDSAHGGESGGPLRGYLMCLRDPIYVTNTLGFAMQSFALGGLAVWAPIYLIRTHGYNQEDAAKTAGKIVAGAGLVGTALGAILADKLATRGRIPAYALVTGAGYLLSAPLLLVGLFLPEKESLACIFVSMVGAFLGTGPSNAIVSERAPRAYRASAFALLIVILHLLGDAASPPILGGLSDWFQNQGLGSAQALQRSLVLAPVALLIGACAMAACSFFGRSQNEKSAESAR